MKRILFVCLGNICRSSSAEEIMRTYIKRAGLEKEIEVDSAGISSYHQGELADDRMRAHAIRRGYILKSPVWTISPAGVHVLSVLMIFMSSI